MRVSCVTLFAPPPPPTPAPTNLTVQTLEINPSKTTIDSFVLDDFKLVGYNPHKKIEMKMAV
jgi:dihydrofolate reductase/thymidylate synthase